jgi:hypothetical protein
MAQVDQERTTGRGRQARPGAPSPAAPGARSGTRHARAAGSATSSCARGLPAAPRSSPRGGRSRPGSSSLAAPSSSSSASRRGAHRHPARARAHHAVGRLRRRDGAALPRTGHRPYHRRHRPPVLRKRPLAPGGLGVRDLPEGLRQLRRAPPAQGGADLGLRVTIRPARRAHGAPGRAAARPVEPGGRSAPRRARRNPGGRC